MKHDYAPKTYISFDFQQQKRRIWLNRMQKEMNIKREKLTAPIRRMRWNLWLMAMEAKA